MDNPIYVMMPVLCVGKMCTDCPHIVIGVEVEEYSTGCSETFLKCKNVNKCIRIKQMMEEDHDKRTGQNP